MPSPDLYRRAEEELGITGTMCMPWAGGNPVKGADAGLLQRAEAYRPAIETFAETHRLASASNVTGRCVRSRLLPHTPT